MLLERVIMLGKNKRKRERIGEIRGCLWWWLYPICRANSSKALRVSDCAKPSIASVSERAGVKNVYPITVYD